MRNTPHQRGGVSARWLLSSLFLGTLGMGEHLPLGYRPAAWELKMLADVHRQLKELEAGT